MSQRKPTRACMLAGSSLLVVLAAALFASGGPAPSAALGCMIGCTLPLEPAPTDPIVTAIKHDGGEARNPDRYFAPLTAPPKTKAALDQVGEIDWLSVPLETAIGQISDATGVEFQFSESGMEEAAITTDAEVTFRSKSLTYGRALRSLLTELDLACVLYDEYVLITSREAAELLVETRTYALVDHPLLRRFRDGQLVETICDHVEPDEWPQFDGVGASHVSVIPGALVVTTNQMTHEKVEAFLKQYARILADYDPAEAEQVPADPFGPAEGEAGGPEGNAPGGTTGGFM